MKRKNLFIKIMSVIFFLMFIVSLFNLSMASSTNTIFKIENVDIIEKSDSIDNTLDSFTNGEVVSSTVFHNIGDYVLYKLTIKNDTSNNYIIKSVYDNNTNDYIDYIYDNLEDKKVDAKTTFDLIVKVVYKNEMIDLSNRNQDSSIKLSINYLDENDDSEIGDIVVPDNQDNIDDNNTTNPVTGTNVERNIFILVFSLLGLLICLYVIIKERKNNKEQEKVINNKSDIKKQLKNNKTKKNLVLLLGLLLIPIAIKASALSFEVIFTFKFGFYDKYIINYELDGIGTSKIVSYGKKIEIDVPEKVGYKFNGWKLDNGEYFDANNPISGDINITADYSIINYNISYSLNNGVLDNVNPTTYTINDEIILNNPTKKGHIFLGWKGTDIVDISKNVVIPKGSTLDRSYMASFDAIKYQLKYSGITEQELINSNNPTYYTVLEQVVLNNINDRYDQDGDKVEKFVGWKENSDISLNMTIPIGTINDKTFTAVWENVSPNTYTITYLLDGGILSSENPTSFTKYDNTFTLNEPTKEGYNFIGWTGSNGNTPQKNVKVEKGTRNNLSFTANYVPIEYTITYNLNGGSATNINTYTIEDSVEVNNPTKVGYNFIGWTGTDLYAPTKDLVIPIGSIGEREYQANYESINYDITYNLNGGSVYGNPDTYNIESSFTLNKPTKDGYHFIGWIGSCGNTPVENLTIYTGTINSLSYEAVFEANKYYIDFKENGTSVTGTMSSQELTYDVESTLNSNQFVRTDYYFDSWNTEMDGSGTKYLDNSSVINLKTSGTINLYAQWKIETYTISFDSNSSDASGEMADQVVDKNTTVNLNKNLFTRDEFQFVKWNTQSDGNGQDYNDLAEVTNLGDITLYAIWEVKPFSTVFSHPGSCSFGGLSDVITGDECQEYDGMKYIDTGVSLYSSENYNKDFEIGLTLDSFDGSSSNQEAQAVFVNTKLENGSNLVTGFVLRKKEHSTSEIELSSTINNVRVTKDFKISEFNNIKIIRLDGVLYYSYNNGRIYFLQDVSDFHDYYNLSTWFGAASLNGEPIRVLDGQISDFYIKLGDMNVSNSTVTFDANGGTCDFNSKQNPNNYPVGVLPVCTNGDYKFGGWYADQQLTTSINEQALITEDVTYYAKWITDFASVGGNVYPKINTAINYAGENDIIKLLCDTGENVVVGSGKNITIDLQGYTIKIDGSNPIIENNGKLILKNGSLITNSSSASVINNTGNLELINVSIINNSSKQGIYNKGGTLKIGEDVSIKTNSSVRASVHNLNNGTLTITGGSIISNNYSAVYNESGEMTIGIDDNTINNSNIVIQGKIYGVNSNSNYYLYDGTIKGATNSVNNTNKIIFKAGNTYQLDSENIDNVSYETLHVVSN